MANRIIINSTQIIKGSRKDRHWNASLVMILSLVNTWKFIQIDRDIFTAYYCWLVVLVLVKLVVAVLVVFHSYRYFNNGGYYYVESEKSSIAVRYDALRVLVDKNLGCANNIMR